MFSLGWQKKIMKEFSQLFLEVFVWQQYVLGALT
jgi:hypothetical protein